MVFLTTPLLVRIPNPDSFWRKRKILKLAAHFWGRRRNCYSIAIRAVHRSLLNSTLGRKLKKDDMKALWQNRVDAASEQHGLSFKLLNEGLTRSNILLSRKSLADLAIWEPRTFQSLAGIAYARIKQDGIKSDLDPPATVITQEPIK